MGVKGTRRPRGTKGARRKCLSALHHNTLLNPNPIARDVLEERRHSPFQVLDASAMEGIRGLAGESSSIYSCIQIYKALTPPTPPAYRGATEGPGPPSYVGSSEERPCPDLGLCAPPSTPAGAGAAVGGWAPPPPDDCTCRVKPRLKSPPPRGGKRAAAPLRCEGRP